MKFNFLPLALLISAGVWAQEATDTVIVQPAAPTDKDSLTLTLLFRERHCCITQYYDKTVGVEDTMRITLSYQASDSNCDKVMCPAGGQTSFSSGPLAAGTYAVYMAESPYCPPGMACILSIIYERVGQVTVTRSVTAESGALRPAAGLLDISPNPFNASVCVVFANPGKKADLSLYTTDGKRVKTFRNVRGEKVSWNAQGLPAGVYVLRAVVGGNILTRKMILAK